MAERRIIRRESAAADAASNLVLVGVGKMIIEIPADEIWPKPCLIRAARGLVGIDQATLAKSAKVSRKAVIALENDSSETMDYRRVAVLKKLAAALEKKYEVEFTRPTASRGEGVRLLKSKSI
jgi:DNA-binding XRE family transcriptional regulator